MAGITNEDKIKAYDKLVEIIDSLDYFSEVIALGFNGEDNGYYLEIYNHKGDGTIDIMKETDSFKELAYTILNGELKIPSF